MRAWWLVLLCGCNRIFGLASTRTVDAPPPPDAQYFDAPADAPYACPADGTPPMFSRLLHQVIEENCWSYTPDTSNAQALASCYTQAAGTQVSAGPIDQAMTPVMITTSYAQGSWWASQYTRDTDMFITAYDGMSLTYLFAAFVRGGDGTWTDGSALTFPWAWGSGDALSVPSRAPARRMMYYRYADLGWHELVESSPGTWTLAGAKLYANADLGTQYISTIQMGGDGLHMVAYAEAVGATEYAILYTSRPTLDADFPPFQPIPSVPEGASYPFLTDDCSRLYFSGLSSVLYVQQE